MLHIAQILIAVLIIGFPAAGGALYPPDSVNVPVHADTDSAYYNKGKMLYEAAAYDDARSYITKAKDLYEANHNWEMAVRCYIDISQIYYAEKRYETALTYLTRAVETGIYHFGENHELIALSYNNIGSVHYIMSAAYDTAMVYYKRSLDIRLRVLGEDNTDTGVSYSNIGLIYYLRREYPEAAGYYLIAASIIESQEGLYHKVLGDCYAALGDIYWRQGEYDIALDYHYKALSIRREVLGEINPLTAVTYNSISLCYSGKGDYDRALDAVRNAVYIILQPGGDTHQYLAYFYNTMGNLYWRKNDFERAIDYHSQALAVRVETLGKEHANVATNYTNIGNIHTARRDFESALEYYQKALHIRLKLFGENHAGVALLYNNMGSVYHEMSDYRTAYDFHRRALTIRASLYGVRHPDIAVSHSNIGLVYKEMGRYDESIEYFQKALATEIDLHGQYHPDISKRYRLLADVYRSKDNHELALNYLQKSIRALYRAGDETPGSDLPPFDTASSEIYLLASLKSKAAMYAHLAESSGHTDLNEKRLHLERSLLLYEHSADLTDKIRTGYKSEGSKLLLVEHGGDIYEHGIQTSLSLYELTRDTRYIERAYYINGKSKAAVLQDGIAQARAVQFAGLPAELLEEERQVRFDIAHYDTRLQQEYLQKDGGNAHKIREYEGRLFNLKSRYHELLELFETQYPGYFALKYRTHTAAIAEIQNNLPDDTILLEYFTGKDEIFIFPVWKTGFDAIRVPLPSDFQTLVSDYYTSILKSETGRYIAAASHLGDLLIAPVKPALKGHKKLIVIPHDYLYKISFEALLTDSPPPTDGPGRVDFRHLPYLIKSYDIAYHYSANLLFENSANTETSGRILTRIDDRKRGSFIGFAPVFSQTEQDGYILASDEMIELASHYEELMRSVTVDGRRFDELQYSEWEVRSIIELFAQAAGDRSSSAYLHTQATKEAFKEAARNYRIVHIATHSFINEDKPQLSGVVFAPHGSADSPNGSILFAGETYNLDLDADLVVLSSCESGVGNIVRGEGMIALSRGFLYSGSRNIMFSLWKIPDKHTSELMIGFYGHLISGYSYAESLREAKLHLIANHSTARPRSWASFLLVGSD